MFEYFLFEIMPLVAAVAAGNLLGVYIAYWWIGHQVITQSSSN